MKKCLKCKHLDFDISNQHYLDTEYLCKKRSVWNEKKQKWSRREWVTILKSCDFWESDEITVIEKIVEKIIPNNNQKKLQEEIDKLRKQVELLSQVEEPEFPCPHCDMVYPAARSLKRHITMKHKENSS